MILAPRLPIRQVAAPGNYPALPRRLSKQLLGVKIEVMPPSSSSAELCQTAGNRSLEPACRAINRSSMLAGIDARRNWQPADNPAHHQGHENQIVDPAEDRDQVGDDVDRIDQIECDEQRRGLEVEGCLRREESLPELDDF